MTEGGFYRTAGPERVSTRPRRFNRRERYERLFAFGRSVPTPEDVRVVREEQERVRQVLGILQSRDAELLVLRSQGLSYEELASALSLSPVSVGTYLTRAQQAFRNSHTARKYRKGISMPGTRLMTLNVSRWVDDRLRSLNPGENWQPSVAQARIILQGQARQSATKKRLMWAAASTIASGFSILAFPAPRAFAQHRLLAPCVEACQGLLLDMVANVVHASDPRSRFLVTGCFRSGDSAICVQRQNCPTELLGSMVSALPQGNAVVFILSTNLSWSGSAGDRSFSGRCLACTDGRFRYARNSLSAGSRQ